MNGYNGWTNRATWHVNLLFGGWIQSDLDTTQSVESLADQIMEYVMGYVSDAYDESPTGQHEIIIEFAEDYLRQVNWMEIAQAIKS